jgi:hypothetical protein
MEAITGFFENMGCIYQTKTASQTTSTLLQLHEPHISLGGDMLLTLSVKMLYQLLRACGDDDDDDDDTVNLHINFNTQCLQTHYGSSISMAQSWSCIAG